MSTPTKFKLYRRSNGVYYIIQEIAGKKLYRSTSRTVKSDAFKVLADHKRLFAEKSSLVALSVFIRDFLHYAEGTFFKGTCSIYRSALEKFRAFTDEPLLTSLTSLRADQYKANRLEQCKPVTVNIELRTLRAAFNTPVRWNLLEDNPFQGIKLTQIAEQEPTFFSREEFQRLLCLIKEDWLKKIIILAVLTGN
jgi:hypothetical protein